MNALGGNDGVTATTLPAGVVKLTVDGGAGDDTILGSRAPTCSSAATATTSSSAITAMTWPSWAPATTRSWDPGDGNNTVEGQDGVDRMLFNGSNVAENIDIAANGPRVLFIRDVANVTIDLDDVRADRLQRPGRSGHGRGRRPAGTDATTINLNLASTLGGNVGDGQVDNITVNGTNGNDTVAITGSGTSATVAGLPATVHITGSEGANDRLTVNAQGGNDTIDASGLAAGVIGLTLNGGLGVDALIGSQGNDLVNGGDGNDLALLGAGDDTFVWNPGDDNDTVEGQAGTDRLLFNGTNASENIDISANGGRVRFFRDIANVTMDLDDVEHIDFNALGGADTIVVGDLSGTDVTEINLNLAVGGGAGDAQPDNVIVNGTNGDDAVLAVGDATSAAVLGLAAQVNITGAEAANDRLTVNALAGDDVVDASAWRLARSI